MTIVKVDGPVSLQREGSTMKYVASLITALSAAGMAPHSMAQPQPTTIQLRQYLGAVWSFEAELGGKRQTFLFDTGGGITVITPAVAADIGCVPWGQLTGFRMRGDRVDMTRCDDVTIRSDAAPLAAPTVGVFDLTKLLPEDAPPVAGSVALDSFAGKMVTIDLGHRRLVIETPDSLKRRIATAREVRIRLAREISGFALMPYLAVRTSKGTAWMEMDTGSDASIIVGNHLAGLFGMTTDKAPQRFQTRLAGDVALTADDAHVMPLIFDGNIGEKVLKDWVVTIDLAHGRAWIAPAARP